MSSFNALPSPHPPGRSRTRAAWSALLVSALFFFLFFFHSFLLKVSVESALWVLQPFTGLNIKAEKTEVAWGKPIHWHQMTVTSGKAPFVTKMTFADCSLQFSSLWRLCFGDHLLISSLQAKGGNGTIDLRTTASAPSYWKKTFSAPASILRQALELLPASADCHDVSFLLLTEGERYTVNHLSCALPNKLPGWLSYESIFIEAGKIHCHLAAGKSKALWTGKKLTLRQLLLAEEMTLQKFTLIPHHDRIELDLIAKVFDGLLRADGSLHQTAEGTFIDSALLGQQLPLGHLSRFLGLKKNLSGMLREGRLTFRGSMLHPMDADVSLRMLADNVRLEKRGWASLSVTANLIGRKISLTDFQLKQHENRVTASGDMTLPEEWRKLAQAPFLLKLKANISDASQLADLIGTSWSNITGKLFADGEVHGAANCANGYLNIQGTAMTAYGIPLNSLKLQLLFQKEKTQLTNLELWSNSDHLECSGTVENKWPHHYEGRATLQSSDLSQKCLSLVQQYYIETPSSWGELSPFALLKKSKLQEGSVQASWEGHGEAKQHEGFFNISLNNLFQDLHKISGHGEGYYGSTWISFSSLAWEDGLEKFTSKLTLSSRGIDLQKFSLSEDHMTTLAGSAFLPLDATVLLHQPFLFSQALLRDLPFALHLQCHRYAIMQHLASLIAMLQPTNNEDSSRSLKASAFSKNLEAILDPSLFPSAFDGNIDGSGSLEKPTLHLSLVSKNREAEKRNSKMKLLLSAQQGEGSIDAALTTEKNKTLTVQGKLPVGLILQKEGAPLQESERWKWGAASALLDLKISIPELSFDEMATYFLPSFFHVERSSCSGNIACKGTLAQIEPSGELQLQAGSISFCEALAPLHHFQGRLLFSKENLTLQNASALMGKEKITMVGKTEWQHQQHDYQFSGENILLYQSPIFRATGNLNLSLQGENQTALLHGNIVATNIEGSPKLFVTPFLTPPGIITPPPSLIKSDVPACWPLDIAVTMPPDMPATSLSRTPFNAMNLHLAGNLLAPTLEGTISFGKLPLIFPNGTFSLLEGNCSFEPNMPWQPLYNLTAGGTMDDRKITATLLKNKTLQLQSDPFVSPTALALELGVRQEASDQEAESWLSQLPYWLREQSLMEPTPLSSLTTSHTSENYNTLGFSGCGISYQAEMK